MRDLCCRDCGETWMCLSEEGVVVVREDGAITAWAGDLQCAYCGRQWTLDELLAPALKLVQ